MAVGLKDNSSCMDQKQTISFNFSIIYFLYTFRALSTTETALTAHLVTTQETMDNTFLIELQQYLHDKFGVDHTTIQIEKENSENNCKLNRPKCI